MLRDILSVAAIAVAVFIAAAAWARFADSARGRSLARRLSKIDERLAAFPDRAEARVIAASPRGALIRFLPWTLPLSVFLFVSLVYARDPQPCSQVLGLESGVFALLMLTHAVPALILLMALTAVPMGLKVLRRGYFPPLDSPRFFDGIARKGIGPRLRGAAILALPVLGLVLVVIGHSAFMSILDGRPFADFVTAVAAECDSAS